MTQSTKILTTYAVLAQQRDAKYDDTLPDIELSDADWSDELARVARVKA